MNWESIILNPERGFLDKFSIIMLYISSFTYSTPIILACSISFGLDTIRLLIVATKWFIGTSFSCKKYFIVTPGSINKKLATFLLVSVSHISTFLKFFVQFSLQVTLMHHCSSLYLISAISTFESPPASSPKVEIISLEAFAFCQRMSRSLICFSISWAIKGK